MLTAAWLTRTRYTLEEIMTMPVTDFLFWPKFFDPPTLEILKAFFNPENLKSTDGVDALGITAAIDQVFAKDEALNG